MTLLKWITPNGTHRSREQFLGQATTEYLLIVAIVTLAFVILKKGLTEMEFAQKITGPIFNEFASAYRYGHTQAKGYDDGGPENHPRALEGNSNFRIFINPGRQ